MELGQIGTRGSIGCRNSFCVRHLPRDVIVGHRALGHWDVPLRGFGDSSLHSVPFEAARFPEQQLALSLDADESLPRSSEPKAVSMFPAGFCPESVKKTSNP